MEKEGYVGAYQGRWTKAISETRIGASRAETVFNFIKAFKGEFDGNGPVLEEIGRMLSEVYRIEVPNKRLGSYYIDKLIEKGLIETEATKAGEGLQRSPGRIILRQSCWECWEANQELEKGNKEDEAIAGAVPIKDTSELNSDLVGETGLL
jgi:hypothetical protein